MTTATEIEAARLLLARLGLTPEQLIDTTVPTTAPTFDHYIPYGTYPEDVHARQKFASNE